MSVYRFRIDAPDRPPSDNVAAAVMEYIVSLFPEVDRTNQCGDYVVGIMLSGGGWFNALDMSLESDHLLVLDYDHSCWAHRNTARFMCNNGLCGRRLELPYSEPSFFNRVDQIIDCWIGSCADFSLPCSSL